MKGLITWKKRKINFVLTTFKKNDKERPNIKFAVEDKK